MSCSKGVSSLVFGYHTRPQHHVQSACKYSHDWNLTPEQLILLAKNAKKAPCNFYKNGP